MNMHNVILEKGVELKKNVKITIEVHLTETENLIFIIVFSSYCKQNMLRFSWEFEECMSPDEIPNDWTINLKSLLLHDMSSRDKFVGTCVSDKIRKKYAISIFDDFPYVNVILKIGKFESRARIESRLLENFLTISNNLDIDPLDEK